LNNKRLAEEQEEFNTIYGQKDFYFIAICVLAVHLSMFDCFTSHELLQPAEANGYSGYDYSLYCTHWGGGNK
jgi:hypothetical protein